MKKSAVLKILIFTFLLFLSGNFLVKAQENNEDTLQTTSFSVSPVIIEAIVDPGNPTNKELYIINQTNVALPIKLLKEALTAQEKVSIAPDQLRKYDASLWINLKDTDKDFILGPKEVKRIDFTITPPADASPGGHYASLIFQPLVPIEAVSEQTVLIFSRVTVLLMIQVKGDVQESLEISQIVADSVYESMPVTVNMILSNTGNTHVSPTGYIDLTNEFTGRTTKVAIPPGIILPGTQKSYQVDLSQGFFYGKFTAQANIIYGMTSQSVSSNQISFFVIPYKLTTLIILVIAIIIILRKRISKALQVLVALDETQKAKQAKISTVKFKIKGKTIDKPIE